MTSAIFFVIIIVLLAGVYFMWRTLMARGFRAVVAIFRAKRATDPKRAATLEELGLEEPRGIFGRFFRRRDYKQTAMRILGQSRIILMTPGEKFYLSEEALAYSRYKTFAKID